MDRDAFSAGVTQLVESQPNITVVRKEVTELDESLPTLVATGPPHRRGAAGGHRRSHGGDELLFYDAAGPHASPPRAWT